MVAATKLSSNTSASAIDMANAIFGAGMTVPDAGHTGVALTTVNPVLCFTQGSKIRTAKGEVMIQDLCIGDRVITRDSGLLPIRWMSARKVAGLGRFAPVIIEAGTLGAEVQLRLSQHHRVLMRGAIAELYCGEREVLVKAHQLVNGTTIRLDTSGAAIEYFHILFDTHEIIWANGVESESFSPPPQVLNAMEESTRAEVLALFPELAQNATAMQAARQDAKNHEVRLLGQWAA